MDENASTLLITYAFYTIQFFCITEKKLNEQCIGVMLCVDDAQVSCIGGTCGCNTGYYDSDGPTVGGTCVQSKSFRKDLQGFVVNRYLYHISPFME